MDRGTCVERFRDANNNITMYAIRMYSNNQVLMYEPDNLKTLIEHDFLAVDNLKLASDNRLLLREETQEQLNEVREACIKKMLAYEPKVIDFSYEKIKSIVKMDSSSCEEIYTPCGHKIFAVDENNNCDSIIVYIPNDVEILPNNVKVFRGAFSRMDNLTIIGGINVLVADDFLKGLYIEECLDLSQMVMPKCVSFENFIRSSHAQNVILNPKLFYAAKFMDFAFGSFSFGCVKILDTEYYPDTAVPILAPSCFVSKDTTAMKEWIPDRNN